MRFFVRVLWDIDDLLTAGPAIEHAVGKYA